MSVRAIVSDALKYVPQIFGRASEGNVTTDLNELAQVYSVQPALLRSLMQRRVFRRQNVHGGAGAISVVNLDFWASANWSSIYGPGGATVGEVPQDHDILIRSVSIRTNSGANLLVAGYAHVIFPPVTGLAMTADVIMASARAGASANYLQNEPLSAPYLPFPLGRSTGASAGVMSEVSAATAVDFFIDVISAPMGAIDFGV